MSSQIEIRYEGDGRCVARAEQFPSVTTDAANAHGGRGEQCTPTDLLAIALGNCLMTVVGLVAKGKQIDVSGMTASVTKHDASGGARRAGGFDVVLRLPGRIGPDDREKLERADALCPVKNSLRDDVPVNVRFDYSL